jgi:hypothetical protein
MLNGDVDTATAVDFGTASVTSATGDYLTQGLVGRPATFNDFTFAPFASPVPNLWSVTAADADVFTMSASSLTTLTRSPGDPLGSIELRGLGTATGTGFDPTPGAWIVTLNTADNGVSFSFSASSAATPRVPDGGSTLLLLGAALSMFGLVRRKLLG